MSEIDLGALECFADVAELGSFTAAAKRRAVSQPAISMRVRQLERQLGVRLVERVGRSVAPTFAGQDLLAHVAALRAEVARTLAAIAPHQAGENARVRIGTGATACIYRLPPLLRRLRQRMPGLSITVQTGNTPDILALLEDNQLDVGFVTLPARGRALSVEPVLREELVAVHADDGSPLRPATPAGLAGALILYEPGGGTRGLVDGWFAAAGFSPRPLMQLGSVEAIKELVGAGLGSAILPAAAVTGPTGGRPSLRIASLTPRLDRTLGLVLRRDKLLDRGLREVVTALRSLGPDDNGRPLEGPAAASAPQRAASRRARGPGS